MSAGSDPLRRAPPRDGPKSQSGPQLPSGRWVGAILGGLAVVGLAIVVGLASRTSAFSLAQHPAAVGHFPIAVGETLLLLVATALLAGLFATAWAVAHVPERRRRSVATAPILSVFGVLALAAIIYLITHYLHFHIQSLRIKPSSHSRLAHGLKGKGASGLSRFEWTPLGVVVVALLVAAGLWAARARRQARRWLRQPFEETSAEAALLAVESSLDDLLAETDPRKAVIAAYASMEVGLGRSGFPRRASEAPREFVGRALRGLAISEGAVNRLTALFEEARFSRHEVGEDMRREAIAALRAVRAELDRHLAGEAAA
jgi:hypothetical protein